MTTVHHDSLAQAAGAAGAALRGSARAKLGVRVGRRLALGALARLREGELTIVEGGERLTFGRAAGGLRATVRVHDAAFWRLAAFGGSAGAGESFIEGHWSCDDLTALVRILVRNEEAMETLDGRLARVLHPLAGLAHWLRRNTRSGSRRNIRAHYDLGDDFFATFLDPTMMYSCALFDRADMTLEEASVAKLRAVCAKLDLRASDHVLEIGTGWGGLAIHAAREHGCRVTTTTISRNQAALARRRVEEAGLAGLVTVLESDYRDLTGRYDKLVSIEMVEAVGREYLGTFMGACARLLKPEGAMLLQAITIRDQRHERAAREADFLKRFIFPGSCLLSVEALARETRRATDLRLIDLEDIGPHYARTLREWRARFEAGVERVRAMGFDERFVRMWRFYLSYCEGAFLERFCSDVQAVFVKPRSGLAVSPGRRGGGERAPAEAVVRAGGAREPL